MENVVYYFLIALGAILVWISLNTLKKLKINNQQWAEVEQQSHLYHQDNYVEAEKLVKKLQKIIPFLSKFALLNGVFAIVGSLLGLVGLFNNVNLSLSNLGFLSFFLIILPFLFMIKFDGAFYRPFTSFNTVYQFILEYGKNNINKYTVQEYFNNYFRKNEINMDNYSYNGTIKIRFYSLSTIYTCFLLFCFCFLFDKGFNQIMSNFFRNPLILFN
ncbi:MAG: hypothetical protein IKH45_06750 [Neisseriaceae bacterium]|nr:hypothetical protein [Neisseriaceae bacterium]